MLLPWYLYLLYLALLMLSGSVIVIVFFWESSLIFNRAPFIPMPQEVVPHIIQALDLQEGNVVFDLGCGEGRILSGGYAAQPKARFIGVERSWLPYCIARFKTRKYPKDALRIVRGSLLKQDVTQADRIFVYLFPGLMRDVLLKLQKELKPGARVVSCDFEFKGKEPLAIIDLDRPVNKLGRRIFVYRF